MGKTIAKYGIFPSDSGRGASQETRHLLSHHFGTQLPPNFIPCSVFFVSLADLLFWNSAMTPTLTFVGYRNESIMYKQEQTRRTRHLLRRDSCVPVSAQR